MDHFSQGSVLIEKITAYIITENGSNKVKIHDFFMKNHQKPSKITKIHHLWASNVLIFSPTPSVLIFLNRSKKSDRHQVRSIVSPSSDVFEIIIRFLGLSTHSGLSRGLVFISFGAV